MAVYRLFQRIFSSNFSILIDINPKRVKIKCKKNVTNHCRLSKEKGKNGA